MIVGISFISCKNMIDEIQIPVQDEKQVIFELNKGILSFQNEIAFQNTVEKVRNNQVFVTSLTRSVKDNDFVSLYEEFEQAMKEAESFYDREGGYEEFKVKFPNLFYPERGDDYSAYLPISDEAIAKLANRDGKVIIAGEERDLRDIFTYEKLKELNLTLNDEDYDVMVLDSLSQMRSADFEGAIPITVYPGVLVYNAAKNRKIYAVSGRTLGYKDLYSPLTGEVHLAFRKKGAFGIWYNHWALTRIRINIGSQRMLDGTKDGYSSHNYTFEVPYNTLSVTKVDDNVWRKWVITFVQFTYDAMDGYVFNVNIEHYMHQGWP